MGLCSGSGTRLYLPLCRTHDAGVERDVALLRLGRARDDVGAVGRVGSVLVRVTTVVARDPVRDTCRTGGGCECDRQTDRQRDRLTDRQTDKHRQTDRQTNEQTYRPLREGQEA